jgi:hypothetical protein
MDDPPITTPTPTPPPATPSKRPRAKKLKAALGPFATGVSTYDSGRERQIEVTLTPHGTVYRLKGQSGEYVLPHPVGFQKAVSLKAGAVIDPRQGRITRGNK